MSDNSSQGRPLTRREIREREEAAARARAAASGVPGAQAPAAPAPAAPVVPPTRRSLHTPSAPEPAVHPVVRPPSVTGGVRGLDETGRLTPVQRGGVQPVPARPAPAAPGTPTRTSARMPVGQPVAPPSPTAFPRPAADASSYPGRGAAPSFGQTGAAPQQSAAPSFGRTSPSAAPSFGSTAGAGAAPAPSAPGAPSRTSLNAPFGTVAAPAQPAVAPQPSQPTTPPRSPWGATPVAGANPASPPVAPSAPSAPSWGSITGAGAATAAPVAPAASGAVAADAGAGTGLPGSLPPARPQPSPFDSFVTPEQPVRSRAETAADEEGEDEPRPSYTWLHYIILIVVGFVLGWLLWQIIDNDEPSFAPDADASAVTTVIDTLSPPRGTL